MLILGLDIGGANIKAALIKNGTCINQSVKYYPMWTNNTDDLPKILTQIKDEICGTDIPEAIAVTMTAELSDAFYTKRAGILEICMALRKVVNDDVSKLHFINIYGHFIAFNDVLENPLQIAAANWVATSKFVSGFYKNCILIDTGSTTTDIIPILNGIPQCYGKHDPDRLLSGELVYTGILRTEIPAITHNVPYKGNMCRISSEKFALSADIHLILGHITQKDYMIDTADGRDKDEEYCLARIARINCADIEMLNKSEIIAIANYIYLKQVQQVQEGLKQVLDSLSHLKVSELPIIITGLGADCLARPAASNLHFKSIINLDMILGENKGIAAPSIAIALLLEIELKGD